MAADGRLHSPECREGRVARSWVTLRVRTRYKITRNSSYLRGLGGYRTSAACRPVLNARYTGAASVVHVDRLSRAARGTAHRTRILRLICVELRLHTTLLKMSSLSATCLRRCACLASRVDGACPTAHAPRRSLHRGHSTGRRRARARLLPPRGLPHPWAPSQGAGARRAWGERPLEAWRSSREGVCALHTRHSPSP